MAPRLRLHLSNPLVSTVLGDQNQGFMIQRTVTLYQIWKLANKKMLENPYIQKKNRERHSEGERDREGDREMVISRDVRVGERERDEERGSERERLSRSAWEPHSPSLVLFWFSSCPTRYENNCCYPLVRVVLIWSSRCRHGCSES